MTAAGKELISYVFERTSHYCDDLNTFLWVRTDKALEFAQLSKPDRGDLRLGGGNLIGAAGLFRDSII